MKGALQAARQRGPTNDDGARFTAPKRIRGKRRGYNGAPAERGGYTVRGVRARAVSSMQPAASAVQPV